MSTLATNAITDAAGGNTATINGQTPTESNMAGRNRLINSDMRIDQRNAGAAVTPTDGQYTADRWNAGLTQASKFSVQQSSVAPAGFTNSLLVTSLSAYSVESGDLFRVSQFIEGFNTSDLGWGTANAEPVTLSFWVRSSLTGTFGGSLINGAQDRSYPFSYTISSADTWEQKSVTIAGDTTGTWLTTNGIGIRLTFGLGAGSSFSDTAGAWAGTTLVSVTGATSVVGTSGATFYITGVQLEKGSTATSFDYRPYGTELQLCQRYFARVKGNGSNSYSYGTGIQPTPTTGVVYTKYPCTMRSTPTITGSGIQLTDYTGFATNATIATTGAGFDSAQIELSMSSNGASLRPIAGYVPSTGYLDFASEL